VAAASVFNLPTIQTSIESCFNSVLTISTKPRAMPQFALREQQPLCQPKVSAEIQSVSEIHKRSRQENVRMIDALARPIVAVPNRCLLHARQHRNSRRDRRSFEQQVVLGE
jgi:hypothetical protein